jgi:hypothetical protein
MSEPRIASYEDIEYALMHQRSSRATLMPRFTPQKWWECDVCEITESGYFREYEIKMSRADFKVDASKQREVYNGTFWRIGDPPRPIENKHSLLSLGDTRGPVEFYFVTPIGLLKPEEIPSWAGLLEIEFRKYSNYPLEWTKIKALRLHKTKADEGIRKAMLSSAYGRLHHEWNSQYYRVMCEKPVPVEPSPVEVEATLP